MKFKASDIASYLNGQVIGDSNIIVSAVSKIEEGKPGTITFFANPKYECYLYTTLASIVLINRNFEPKEEIKATLIKVDDAYQAFASLLELYNKTMKQELKEIEQPCHIDKTAIIGEDIYVGAFSYIGENAKIGNKVKIYPHVCIGNNAVIGDNSILYSGVKIYDGCIVGNNCILHAGSVIGADGFGFAPQPDKSFKKIPQIGNVIIEDDVEIGANTTIDCGTMDATIIRKGTKIDNLVQIAHNCEIGENSIIAAQTGLAGSTKVGKNCMFAGQVGVVGHLTIGDNVQIGAQSGVTKSIKDNQIVLSSPAFNYKDAIKTYTVFRNLPKLRQELNQLLKDVKSLQQDILASSK